MSWLSAAWHWYATVAVSKEGIPVYPHAGLINPVAAGIGALLLIGTALQQAATARRRHVEQTNADRQRRITESFSKAVEQLASDKIEVRLGGIYTLERISLESRADYWAIMETLTAFVRERARWKEPDAVASEEASEQSSASHELQMPPIDIAAVLTVIVRRPEAERAREKNEDWTLALVGADLRGAFLAKAHLERAILAKAHLEDAYLAAAHLERAELRGAHLEGADLLNAHLQGARLVDAHLEGAGLGRAHLEGARLIPAPAGADLKDFPDAGLM